MLSLLGNDSRSVVLVSLVAVMIIMSFAVLSVGVTLVIKSICHFVSSVILFVGELLAALTAAITSAITVTLTVVLSACVASFLYPSSRLQARIMVSAAVSALGVVSSALVVIHLTHIAVRWNVATAVVSSAGMAVAFAAAWAVGVMSLIEKETRHSGLKITSVMDAVRRNQHRLLQVLLKLQTNHSHHELSKALIYAVRCEYERCVRVILDAGGDPNTRDPRSNSVLAIACECGNAEITSMLLRAGALRGATSVGFSTPLHQCARWGYTDCVQLLLQPSDTHHAGKVNDISAVVNGVEVNPRDGSQRTPLMVACRYAQCPYKVLDVLLSYGALVNARDSEGQSALHYLASRNLDLSVLISSGGDAHQADDNGDTPLHHACINPNSYVHHSTMDVTPGMPGRQSAVEQLIQHGCDVNRLNNQRNTSLHLAALSGNTYAVDQLMQHGANPNIPNLLNCLPTSYAAARGHTNILVKLVQQNCPLGPCMVNGQHIKITNPLPSSLDGHELASAHILVWAGCDIKPLRQWARNVCPHCIDKTGNIHHYEWLHDYLSKACPLQHLCRLVVRKCLSTHLISRTELLPLPNVIKDYVCMKELSLECEVMPDIGEKLDTLENY